MGSVLVRPARVRLAIGDPIPTEGLTLHDHARLTAELRRSQSRELTGAGQPPVQCK